jgi:hypothetical protein
MSNRFTITLVAAFLAFAPLTSSQTPSTKATEGPGRKLAHIKLQLRTIVESTQKTDKTQFGPNDDVAVQVLATNSGGTQVVLAYWKSFIHYLPVLSKAGEVVPYSNAMQKRLADLEARAKLGPVKDSAIVVKLAPNQMSEAALISLYNYYDRLQPGIYELKVKFREQSGLEIESDKILFEVTAEEK